MASHADRIREHVVARLAALATTCGPLVAIRSGDVVRSMGLVNRTPAVCSALETAKFQQMAGLEFVERKGLARSTTTTSTSSSARFLQGPTAVPTNHSRQRSDR